MNKKTEFIIVGVLFNGEKPTHEELADKVTEKLESGYELLGAPFFGPEMMYQAMTRSP